MYDMTLYAILMAVFAVGMTGLAAFLGKKQGLNPGGMCLYGALSAVLGMLIGRGIHCAVCWYEVFFDPMGDFIGVKGFFDPSVGGINVMGMVGGLLLAAPAAAALMKEKAARYLDAAAIPTLGMYILARIIEPLTGQGYGEFLEMYVDVCYLEAVLTAIVLGVVIWLSKRVRREGTLAQYALVLWALTQIFPESLRCDNVLYVLVFARVTHLGLAFTVGLTLLRLLWQGAKHGLSKKAILLDVLGLAIGIGLCIGMIFALDKTNWPKLAVYAGMLLALVELGFIVCRRIAREDVR